MKKELCLFHDPSQGELRLAGLMSGSGSNLRKIIEWERVLRQERGKNIYRVVVIFTDTFDSRASEIGRDFDIPVICRDLKGFYRQQAKSRYDLKVREEFDAETVKALSPFEVKAAAYAGYMSIVTRPLIEAFLGVNVHPADLSQEAEGKRKYTGAQAVRLAIMAGERSLRSTTHLIEPQVDGGRLLMISNPLPVVIKNSVIPENEEEIQRLAHYYQERLKEVGDWVIFPRTIQAIAEGRYAFDKQGMIYFDGRAVPYGVPYEEY